jgi:nucleotide-binding universal stress UspA family protein
MKLLITTDFSTNSKGAIRFAQTLAKQSSEIEAVFYHSVHFTQPIMWSDELFDRYKQEETERLTAELKKFVKATLGKKIELFSNVKYVIGSALSASENIIKYAEKSKMDFICIATQGAGILRKILGTHAAYIVNHSKIPVFVIPGHYRSKPLKQLTYLSDFENVKKEIDKISKFSSTLKCSLAVLHYLSIISDKNKFERMKDLFGKDEYKNIKLSIIKNNFEFSILERVTDYVTRLKPTLLIMFTNNRRSIFESIFLPGKSGELTYTTTVPVLIYSK